MAPSDEVTQTRGSPAVTVAHMGADQRAANRGLMPYGESTVRQFLQNLQFDLHLSRPYTGEMYPTSPSLENPDWHQLPPGVPSRADIRKWRERYRVSCALSDILRKRTQESLVVEDVRTALVHSLDDLSDAPFLEALKVMLLPTITERAARSLGLGSDPDQKVPFRHLNIATFQYQWWRPMPRALGYQVALDLIDMELLIRSFTWRPDATNVWAETFHSVLTAPMPAEPCLRAHGTCSDHAGIVFRGSIAQFAALVGTPLNHTTPAMPGNRYPLRAAAIDAVLKTIVINFVVHYQQLLRQVDVAAHRLNDPRIKSSMRLAVDEICWPADRGDEEFDYMVEELKAYKDSLEEIMEEKC